jgi:hypothetical protein
VQIKISFCNSAAKWKKKGRGWLFKINLFVFINGYEIVDNTGSILNSDYTGML